MERCVIIGASPQTNIAVLRTFTAMDDFVICADGGYHLALAAGLVPSLYVGDGDSGRIPTHTDRIVLPAEKDVTDLQASLDIALSRGYRDFVILGCGGVRFDHYYAALCMLFRIDEQGGTGICADNWNIISLHKGGEQTYPRRKGYKYFSVLPVDDKIEGVTLSGLKYPLDNADMYKTHSLGTSNQFESDVAVVTIKKGRAFVAYSKE
ncbi:thiamine pyrophosphokinase [Clostridia bacterium]|nr:thiamine pyrophosphokinase [Clostridia bacterium]